MKTNVLMQRKLENFDVFQRTSDAMFNATSLLRQWNLESGQKKEMKEYFSKKSTTEFIDALKEEYNLHGEEVPYVKSRASRGDSAGTWMSPLLFIDFAMWLNPRFKVKVLKFVYDELIKNRHLAGDNYKLLSAAVSIFPNANYQQIAKGLNWIVFNKHYKEIRNNATTQQLDELHKIEEQLAFAIEMGLIKDFSSLVMTMRKLWANKWCKI